MIHYKEYFYNTNINNTNSNLSFYMKNTTEFTEKYCSQYNMSYHIVDHRTSGSPSNSNNSSGNGANGHGMKKGGENLIRNQLNFDIQEFISILIQNEIFKKATLDLTKVRSHLISSYGSNIALPYLLLSDTLLYFRLFHMILSLTKRNQVFTILDPCWSRR